MAILFTGLSLRYQIVFAVLAFIAPGRVCAQTETAALLRWPPLDQFSHRFEIVDSMTTTSSKAGLASLRSVMTQSVHLIPARCPAASPSPCRRVGVQLDELRVATSMDSGRSYRTSANLAEADTTVVALSADGIWSEVENGSKTAAGASVEALMSLGLVRLPVDSIRAGDQWPVEVTFGRQTRPFGLLRSFYSGIVRVDSLTPGRAWLTVEGRDSSAASGGEPMVSVVRSSVVWNTNSGGMLESTTSELIVAPRSGITICNRRRVRLMPQAPAAKPAS